MRLSALDTALIIEDLALPGFNLHQLKGERAEIHSIKVSRNGGVRSMDYLKINIRYFREHNTA